MDGIKPLQPRNGVNTNQYRSIFTLSGNAGLESILGWRPHEDATLKYGVLEGAVESRPQSRQGDRQSSGGFRSNYRPRWYLGLRTKWG